jgi:hypothetical protein
MVRRDVHSGNRVQAVRVRSIRTQAGVEVKLIAPESPALVTKPREQATTVTATSLGRSSVERSST